MSVYGTGARIGSNLMKNFGHAGMSVAEDLGMRLERESAKVLRGAFASAAEKTGLLPSRVRPHKTAIQDIIAENASSPGAYATAPFRGGGRFIGRDPRAAVVGSARREELAMKRKASDAKAAIEQQDKMDVAKAAGHITPREIVKQNRILMRRRRAAM